MTLNPHPTYPASGGYVLRLHRDARPEAGALLGRIEHIASGDCSDFASGAELLDWLSHHAVPIARSRSDQGEHP